MATSKPKWAVVKTTLPQRPLPPNTSRSPVITERLLIRPLVPEDVHSLHILRTQPEVMANSPQGRPDKDLEETRQRLKPFLPPNDEATYNCAICLKETGELIGIGGCHNLISTFGWPVIGYMIRKKFWGQGLATEFVKAWLESWCKLPRAEAEIEVDRRTLLPEQGEESSPEQVTALTLLDNVGSQRVLEKAGFERFLTWDEADLRDSRVQVTLIGYRYVLGSRLWN
ncbi:acyl-CoA N-acyltransferase [Trichoderma austrokoningii]